jgi:hypothetical protein
MNAEFEKQLQRQALRELPRQWRAEILAAAAGPRSGTGTSTPASRLSSWFWPCPRAWAGLGAAWLVILGLNLTAGRGPAQSAYPIAPCSRQAVLELRRQQQMLAELISPPANLEAQPPQPADPRRSEIGETSICV